jgi:hypothetical protein
VGKNFQDFIILSYGQPDLEPQLTICNFKKASEKLKKRAFKPVRAFSTKGKKLLPVFNEN